LISLPSFILSINISINIIYAYSLWATDRQNEEPGDAGKTAAAIETALKGNIWLKRNKGTEIYVESKKNFFEYFEKRRLT